MRLLTKKQFQGEMEKAILPYKLEISELEKIINKREYDYLEQTDKVNKLLETSKYHQNMVHELSRKNTELEQKLRQVNGARGGLTKQIKKLQDELDEANKKLSQRYIVKELVEQKHKNTQKMKIKSNAVKSKIIKKVVNND